MKRLTIAVATVVLAMAALAGTAAAGGPVTKQNGSTTVFNKFTSVCAVPGYVNYGYCNGDPTMFTNVTGKVNAVQAKDGRWNLGLSFTNLQPGAFYKLWGNRAANPSNPADLSGFFPIAVSVAAADGTARFSYQTTDPTKLAFDLNKLEAETVVNGITIVTSYWSGQAIQVRNPDGTLYVP